jgi:hypothetical protein
METEPSVTHKPYKSPRLEHHRSWNLSTGGTALPIGNLSGLDNPLEIKDFMEGEQ